eukprot:scaffold41600_cov82-Phaeocystis_antarctica.AAC.1
MRAVPNRLAESLGKLGLCFHWNATLASMPPVWRSHAKPICPPVAPGPHNQRIQELLLERFGDQHEICPAMSDRIFPSLYHQAKKVTVSFYRVIGIFIPVLMLALRQHHSAVEKPCRLSCTLWPIGPIWAKMGLLSGKAVLHKEAYPLSNPASTTPALLRPTHFLQLPAPVSTSSGSQQLRMCKPDIAGKVKLLADVGPWLKENPWATV